MRNKAKPGLVKKWKRWNRRRKTAQMLYRNSKKLSKYLRGIAQIVSRKL